MPFPQRIGLWLIGLIAGADNSYMRSTTASISDTRISWGLALVIATTIGCAILVLIAFLAFSTFTSMRTSLQVERLVEADIGSKVLLAELSVGQHNGHFDTSRNGLSEAHLTGLLQPQEQATQDGRPYSITIAGEPGKPTVLIASPIVHPISDFERTERAALTVPQARLAFRPDVDQYLALAP